MTDPHPLLPAAEGWRIPALAPQTAEWVQLANTPLQCDAVPADPP